MTEATRDSVVQIVQILIANADEEILLLQRRNTGFKDGRFTLPGGHVEHHEPILDAAHRECREETGIEIIEGSVRLVMPYRGGVDYLIEAVDWSGTPRIGEPEKCSNLSWFRRDNLPKQVTTVVRTALKLVDAGIWFHQFDG